MASFSEIAHKKVAGVPVLYLAAGFVAVLALVAWKLKPSTSADTTATDSSPEGLAPTANPYDSLDPDGSGTVTVQQLGPAAATTDPVVKTNSDWVNEGSVWLIANEQTTGSAALTALNKYINGQDRTYAEQQLVDAWFKQNGPPPDGVAEGGTTGLKPAVKQVNPLPGYHTVQGDTDNSLGELAGLYYGRSDQEVIDLLQSANVGKAGNGPYSTGTKVFIPAYTPPKYYYVPSNVASMTSAQIGAKNGGITPAQIAVLNNVSYTTWKKGAKVRVG